MPSCRSVGRSSHGGGGSSGGGGLVGSPLISSSLLGSESVGVGAHGDEVGDANENDVVKVDE